MKSISIAITFLFCAITSFSQHQLGLRTESYAGVSSLALNPAGNLSNPLRWDLNLVGVGVFFENNYAFIRQTNSLDLIRHRNDAEFVLADELEGQTGSQVMVVDFFNNNRKRFVNFNGYVEGPSLALRIGERHSVGLFTNLRSAASSQGIPNAYSFYKYDQRPLYEGFQVPQMTAAMVDWSEVGVNYAFQLPTATGSLGFGVSLKRLQGWEAGYVENLEAFGHTKLPDNTISIGQPNGSFGYAKSEGDAVLAERNGKGFSVDLGFTAVWDEYDEGYRLKLGASLLDIGYLKFDKNAQAHRVSVDSNVQVRLDDYEDFNSIDDLDAMIGLFSEQSLGDSTASRVGDSFKMAMPAALSLQGDYGFTEHFFVNATLVQRLPSSHPAAQRGNLLALTPRIQHRWFSFSMPLSVYNWESLRIGLAARLGFIVVGTDNVGSILGKGDYTGTDFYLAVKVNPFNLGWSEKGEGRQGGKARHGKRGKVKCYDF